MSQKEIIKTGVIGLGNMGRHHVRIYNEIPGSELTAICDIDEAIVNKFQNQFGCNGYTDLDTMLKKEHLDAVTIAAPSSLHYEIANKIISRGIHTLIEKPITDKLDTAKKIIDLAKKNNIVITSGHIERFNPAVSKLKEMVKAGKLGEIALISTKRASPPPNQIKDANVIIDLAVHDIDIICYLLGKLPNQVTVNTAKALNDELNDHAELLLNFGKQTGIVQVNWITPVKVRSLHLTGTKGFAELDYMNQELTIYPTDYTKTYDSNNDLSIQFQPTSAKKIPIQKQDMLTNELTHFLDCIRNGCNPLASGQDAYNALEIALRAIGK